MADFKIIETQEDFDERIKERLERAEKKVREEFKGYVPSEKLQEELKHLTDTHKMELDTLKKTHAEELKKYEGFDEKFNQQESEIKTLRVAALKNKIAIEKQLPLDAIEFLQGDDEETINISADKLMKLSSANRSIGFTRSTEKDEGKPLDRELRELANSLNKR